MIKIPSISDAFRQLVSDTETALIADSTVVFPVGVPKKVYFMQGNIKEVNAKLTKLTQSPDHKGKKYPLVILFRDIKEDLSESQYGYQTEFNAKIAIITLTQATYDTEQREQNTFMPILIPVFQELIDQIRLSSAFGMPTVEQMRIEKYDCYFYGSGLAASAAERGNDKNLFNDFVDAIDVQNISLKLNNICN